MSITFDNVLVPEIGPLVKNMYGNLCFVCAMMYLIQSFPVIIEKINMMFKWQNQFKCLFDNLEDATVFFSEDKLEYVNHAFLRTFQA